MMLTQVTGNFKINYIQVINGKQRYLFVYNFCENV